MTPDLALQLPALSRWIRDLEGSPTMALNAKAIDLKRRGRRIINMAAGEPDFDTPEYIRAAAHEAIESGKTHYTPSAGIPELRAAVAGLVSKRTGLRYEADEVLITSGTKQAVYLGAALLLDPGHEVLIPAPYWVSYPAIVRMFGGAPVPVWAGPESGFKVSPEQLESACTPRTRGVIFNSPSNPTGAAYSRRETEALARWAADRGLWVIADEIYAELRFHDEAYASIAGADPRLREWTVLADGFSKAYAMTGWRVGWLAAARPLAEAADRLIGQTTTCAPSIAQYAALAAITGPQADLMRMKADFRKRRDFAAERLSRIPGLAITLPDAGFYYFLDCQHYLGALSPDGKAVTDSEALCLHLLESEEIALVPGEAFGAPGFVRLSFACDLATLEEAVDRLARGLAALRPHRRTS